MPIEMPAPVADQIQPPNMQQGLGTLSSLLGLKQQQIAIATGQAQQQTAQAAAQQAQQQNQELQGLGQFFKGALNNPAYFNADGSVNIQKLQQDAMTKAPVYGQQYIEQMTAAFNGQVQNRKALLDLSADQRQSASGYLAAFAADPRNIKGNPNYDPGGVESRYLDTIERARSLSQDPGYQRALDGMLMHSPSTATMTSDQAAAARVKGAAQASQVAANPGLPNSGTQNGNPAQDARNLAVATGAPGAALSGPSMEQYQAPGGLRYAQVNPQSPMGMGPQGPTLRQGVPPSGQVLTDSLGRQFRYNQQSNQLEPVGGAVGGAGASPAGTAPSFTQAAPQQQQIQANIEAARTLGDQVGVNRDINRRIIQLAGQASTGPGTQWVHQAAAAAGLPSGASYQELGAFLDRQAAMAANSMGLPDTNLGIETAKQFTGNTQYNNQVILDKTKFVDSLNTAAGAYRAGLDRAVGTGPNPDYNAYQAYRAGWAKNFDPEIFGYENAVRSGDKAEMSRIEADEGRRGMAELRAKRQALMSLVNGQ